MEHSIRAPHGGTVKVLFCQEGDMVSEGTVLVELVE
nr:biotin/lipoyl-containing protein [Pseudomonas sp. Leaf58]